MKFCRSQKKTNKWVREREHEPDCLSNLQFVSGGGGKRQFLYLFIFVFIYKHTRIDDVHIQYIFNIYVHVPYACIYVHMYVFSAANARKQLSLGLEPEFRSSVAFCARFAAPFVHTYIHIFGHTNIVAHASHSHVCVLFAQCVDWHLCIYRIRFNCFHHKYYYLVLSLPIFYQGCKEFTYIWYTYIHMYM